MEFNIEIRKKQLESLDQFISSSRDRVDSILDYLGWTAQKVAETQKETVKCSVNSAHRIPPGSFSKHVQSCAWRKEKYAEDDVPLSEPNPIPGSTIILDDMTKVNVLNNALAQNPQMKTCWRSTDPVPKTSNRLLASFTPDERIALYHFAVASTKGPPEVPEFNIEPSIPEKHNLTLEEIKALERDAKRRRIKYKTKSIHTSRKSTTEVLRELIDSQMEQYEEWLKHDNEVTPKEESLQTESTNNLQPDAVSLSPHSSRSQNSYRSQESRNKVRRSRSKEPSPECSRSPNRKRENHYNYEDRYKPRQEYFVRNRFDDREYDRRRYNTYHRSSRNNEYRSSRSYSRSDR